MHCAVDVAYDIICIQKESERKAEIVSAILILKIWVRPSEGVHIRNHAFNITIYGANI